MSSFINGALRYAAPKASAARLQFGDGEYSAAAMAAMQMAAEARKPPLPDPEAMVPVPLCRTLSRTVSMCGAAATLGGGSSGGGLSRANSGRFSRVMWQDQGGRRGSGNYSDDSDCEGDALDKMLMRAKSGTAQQQASAFAAAPAIAAIARLGADPADFREELGLSAQQLDDEATAAAAGAFAPQLRAQSHGSSGGGAGGGRGPSRVGSMSGAASQPGQPALRASSSGVQFVTAALYSESPSGGVQGGGGGGGGMSGLSGLSASTAHRLSVSNAAGGAPTGSGNSFSGGAGLLAQRRVSMKGTANMLGMSCSGEASGAGPTASAALGGGAAAAGAPTVRADRLLRALRENDNQTTMSLYVGYGYGTQFQDPDQVDGGGVRGYYASASRAASPSNSSRRRSQSGAASGSHAPLSRSNSMSVARLPDIHNSSNNGYGVEAGGDEDGAAAPLLRSRSSRSLAPGGRSGRVDWASEVEGGLGSGQPLTGRSSDNGALRRSLSITVPNGGAGTSPGGASPGSPSGQSSLASHLSLGGGGGGGGSGGAYPNQLASPLARRLLSRRSVDPAGILGMDAGGAGAGVDALQNGGNSPSRLGPSATTGGMAPPSVLRGTSRRSLMSENGIGSDGACGGDGYDGAGPQQSGAGSPVGGRPSHAAGVSNSSAFRPNSFSSGRRQHLLLAGGGGSGGIGSNSRSVSFSGTPIVAEIAEANDQHFEGSDADDTVAASHGGTSSRSSGSSGSSAAAEGGGLASAGGAGGVKLPAIVSPNGGGTGSGRNSPRSRS
ncbi:hypothetical protein HXX76_000123 [Chlamydomonas incerta]|uniref:Uncharacterized protein n=1 Tax=Chlamydomonas incerta TaxID=51695 RepID=A0A836B2C8_CHLIN|nr:hypothetical protein HXX76_000123 [Chlamydomonas incerta]|eukprot:KAG2445507.1 hypothetical protein HXX76_000123 [Chlamydomonas incerta]